jgi:hypothetical protein
MVDIERVVTLDELMDRVPEQLVRDAESRRIEESETHTGSSENNMTKEPSKAKRIREYLDKNPGARNKDAVEALGDYGVTAADVANVKSHQKRTEGKTRKAAPAAKAKAEASSSTVLTSNGPTINWKELEAGVAFVKAAGSVQRAKHLLIIIDQIKDC